MKHVEDKPFLKKLIETQGIHKVAMVATIATTETDKIFAGHVENMSKPALFEFAKEVRNGQGKGEQQNEILNLFGEQGDRADSQMVKKCQAVIVKMTIELDEELQILFLRLKNKYAKDFSNKEALKVILRKLEKDVPGNGKKKVQKVAKVKQEIVENIPQVGQTDKQTIFPTRHIPAKQKREILEKYQHKCAYPNCVNPAEQLHHRTAFGFEQSHESVVPLCKIHHQFAHNGIIKHELKDPEKWRLSITGRKTVYDNLYSKYRNQ